MHKYIIISTTNKTLVVSNFPKLFKFLNGQKVKHRHLNPLGMLFCHELDMDEIRDIFLALLESEEEVVLFEILDCAHPPQWKDKKHLEKLFDA